LYDSETTVPELVLFGTNFALGYSITAAMSDGTGSVPLCPVRARATACGKFKTGPVVEDSDGIKCTTAANILHSPNIVVNRVNKLGLSNDKSIGV